MRSCTFQLDVLNGTFEMRMSLMLSSFASNSFIPLFSIPARKVLSPNLGAMLFGIMDIMLYLSHDLLLLFLIFPFDASHTSSPFPAEPMNMLPVCLSSASELKVSSCSSAGRSSHMPSTAFSDSRSMTARPPSPDVTQSRFLLSQNVFNRNLDGRILLIAFCEAWSISWPSTSIM